MTNGNNNKGIVLSKRAFENRKQLLTDKPLNIVRKKIIWQNTCVEFSSLWLRQLNYKRLKKRRLETAELWFWKTMTKTSLAGRKRNTRCCQETDTGRRNLMATLNKRTSHFRHILKYNDFIKNIL